MNETMWKILTLVKESEKPAVSLEVNFIFIVLITCMQVLNRETAVLKA